MREIVLFIASSLDGFIAKYDSSVDWLFTDEDYGYNEFFASVDTVIMGRKTYAQILEFSAYPYAGTQGFVLTRTSTAKRDENVMFIGENIADLIDTLRQSPGKSILLVGGAEIICHICAPIFNCHLGCVNNTCRDAHLCAPTTNRVFHPIRKWQKFIETRNIASLQKLKLL